MTLKTLVCHGCYNVREIVYVDSPDRGYCADCVIALPIGTMMHAMGFLSLTIPFKPGDRVEAHTAGEFCDGIGTVTDVSFDLDVTPAIVTFHVVIDEKADDLAPDESWYDARWLTKVEDANSTTGSPPRRTNARRAAAPGPSVSDDIESYLQRVAEAAS